jgi:protein-disulfide isomerase
MENDDRNLNRWVDDRLKPLEPEAAWQPDVERALAGVGAYGRAVRTRRRRWGLTLAAALAISSSLFVIPGCQAATCKVRSENLAERLWKSVFPGEDAPPTLPPVPTAPSSAPAGPPVASAAPAKPAPRPPAPAPRPDNFKLSGSPSAPVLCEIYTDYECPACAKLYADVVPQLRADYVLPGKVRLLHRDYPLTQHQYARLAARYANAAGLAGQYDVAVEQLFRTQSSWALTGDIESQLSQVIPPSAMAKVRNLVHSDPHLDDSVEADIAQGRADQLARTPTIVLVFHGMRQPLPFFEYGQLKATLDTLLK